MQQRDRYPRRIQPVTHKLTPEGFVLIQVPARHISGYGNIDEFEVLDMCSGTTAVSTMIDRVAHKWEVPGEWARAAINSGLSYLELIHVIELSDNPGPSAPMRDRNRDHANFNHLYIQVPGQCRYNYPGCLLVCDNSPLPSTSQPRRSAPVSPVSLCTVRAQRPC